MQQHLISSSDEATSKQQHLMSSNDESIMLSLQEKNMGIHF